MPELKRMSREDIDEVYALEKLCFSDPWSISMLEGSLNNENYKLYVLMENGSIIGYGGIMAVLDEGDIVNIAVHPACRKKGYGKMLLSALINEARNMGVVLLHLEVRASNISARALYEKFGFSIDGIRRGYYSFPKEDAVLMTLRITE